jgi:hypothetical protein
MILFIPNAFFDIAGGSGPSNTTAKTASATSSDIAVHFGFKRSAFRLIYHFLGLSCLLTLLTCVTPGFARPIQALECERLVNLEMKDQDFDQALEVIKGQMKIEIVYHGPRPDPATKRDISFAKVPLDQAVARIMRTFGVENHVAIYNTDNNILVQVDVHGFSAVAAAPPLQNPKRLSMDADIKPLALAQTDHLIAQSTLIIAQMKKSARRLTPEQRKSLQGQSAGIEAERAESMKPLSPEQLDQLKARSQLIELDEQRDQPLSSEQLQRLQINSNRIEAEVETKSQPLTNEQHMLLLKEQVQD